MHRDCLEYEAQRARDPLKHAFKVQEQESKEITCNLFKLTLDNALHYRAFLDYENLVHLTDQCDGQVGQRGHVLLIGFLHPAHSIHSLSAGSIGSA